MNRLQQQGIRQHLFQGLVTVVSVATLVHSAFAGPAADAAFRDGGSSKSALILCHGRGKHPRWRVVEPLRKAVHEKLGWHTLSLQMPADDKHAWEYAGDFPEAFDRIKRGIAFLMQEKGVEAVYLMGHSMGARMASAFVAETPTAPISGLVVAGVRNNGGRPFDGRLSLGAIDIPVLDIWGDGGDGTDSRHASEREELRSNKYHQVPIAGANHTFAGYEDVFVERVIAWLKARR